VWHPDYTIPCLQPALNGLSTTMASLSVPHALLKDVSGALDQINLHINRLRNFTASIGQGDEARLELGAEIHSRLKDVEDEMELLRVEVDALETTGSSKRRGGEPSEREAERDRVISLAERLGNDLKRLNPIRGIKLLNDHGC
jgi:hypothetical protein